MILLNMHGSGTLVKFKSEILQKIDTLDIKVLKQEYHSHPEYGLINIPNFLPDKLTSICANELDQIPLEDCKHFTRKGSCMYEHNNLEETPYADQLVHALSSSKFIKWLEELTGVKKLLNDPHLVGAGYVKSFCGDTLQVHTDFNWVEELQLNRAVSIIVYFNKDWNKDWGGSLNFYDTKNEKLLSSIKPDFGNMLIWSYKNLVYHGYPDPMTCPEDECRKGLRLFYLTSESQPDEVNPPHRSLYWFDKEKGIPYDQRTEK